MTTSTALTALSARPGAAGLPAAANRRDAGPQPAQEWDLLFAAVLSRLRRCGTESPAPATLGATVLDCVQALEQLHRGLDLEREGARRLRDELVETHTALSAASLELVDTRAGERRARHQAQHDGLTSLPNRSCFSARLDDALSPGRHPSPAFALLFLDLDDFKPINDRHGHATGDELLRIVASRLARSVRAGDMVCRIGGDEFACLLAAPMGREQLGQVACKLFDAVSAPLKIGTLELIVRPSIGIAICPTDGDTAAALLERADSAMYRAKRRQLGYAFFDRQADA